MDTDEVPIEHKGSTDSRMDDNTGNKTNSEDVISVQNTEEDRMVNGGEFDEDNTVNKMSSVDVISVQGTEEERMDDGGRIKEDNTGNKTRSVDVISVQSRGEDGMGDGDEINDDNTGNKMNSEDVITTQTTEEDGGEKCGNKELKKKRPPCKRKPMRCVVCTKMINKGTREHLTRHREQGHISVSDEDFEHMLKEGKATAAIEKFAILKKERKQEYEQMLEESSKRGNNEKQQELSTSKVVKPDKPQVSSILMVITENSFNKIFFHITYIFAMIIFYMIYHQVGLSASKKVTFKEKKAKNAIVPSRVVTPDERATSERQKTEDMIRQVYALTL